MTYIRYLEKSDKSFWFRLDRHSPETEFENKVNTKRGYVLLENNVPVGLLRYNLFWDNIPFCTMLFVDPKCQKKGYGTKLMKHWEEDMKSQRYGMLLTSTQVDETAQHFYRKLGYKDCGGFVIDIPRYVQPMELFLIKAPPHNSRLGAQAACRAKIFRDIFQKCSPIRQAARGRDTPRIISAFYPASNCR